MKILTDKHMNKILIKYCYIAFLLLSMNIYAIEIRNIVSTCPEPLVDGLCVSKCGDGFVQANLGEECDLGLNKNGKDEDGDGFSDYGCDAKCKVVKNDKTKEWECNEAKPENAASVTLKPEKSEFNKLYLEMIDLYKDIKAFSTSIDCIADGISADDFKACVDQQHKIEVFIAMNKHKPFLCDSFNSTDKIDPKGFPTLTYVDVLSNKQEKTVDIEYEKKCGLGNLLLVSTNLKWPDSINDRTGRSFETDYNCKMYFIKTVSGKYIHHADWVMGFVDDPTGAIAALIKNMSDNNTTQGYATLINYIRNGDSRSESGSNLVNNMLYCIQKIPPNDTRAANCEDPNLCYDILAKSTHALELKKFNNDFNFTKASNYSGVTKFPTAMHIEGYWNHINPAEAKNATELWFGGSSWEGSAPRPANNAEIFGVGYFTIYPEGSTFPWFRDL
jgi:hypothetical protein